MRLWHYYLLPYLPKQWLMGQHRECCALRGLGWGKKHGTVDYVFKYSPSILVRYHFMVIRLLEKKKVQIDPQWKDAAYRGKTCTEDSVLLYEPYSGDDGPLYPEHNYDYLIECLKNLDEKGCFDKDLITVPAEVIEGRYLKDHPDQAGAFLQESLPGCTSDYIGPPTQESLSRHFEYFKYDAEMASRLQTLHAGPISESRRSYMRHVAGYPYSVAATQEAIDAHFSRLNYPTLDDYTRAMAELEYEREQERRESILEADRERVLALMRENTIAREAARQAHLPPLQDIHFEYTVTGPDNVPLTDMDIRADNRGTDDPEDEVG